MNLNKKNYNIFFSKSSIIEVFKNIVLPIISRQFIGGIITLIYAHHIGSFPFMLAQAIGIIVYSRNLLLIYRGQNEKN